MMLDVSGFSFGPALIAPNRTRFRLWAPEAQRAVLEIVGLQPVEMSRADGGWYQAEAACGAGAQYRFRIGDTLVPDPASRMQARDVHDASVVTDPDSYEWKCHWRGRSWAETVIYELHPGLLGGFSGIAGHLTRLSDIGVNAIELMPIADFPGSRNWGYDGVLPFAPDRSYGTPDELKALIDTAHGRGISIFLDVVYNHFGPDGNYLGLYARRFFDESKHTPWGAAINFAEPNVRRFFIENALYWLNEFRFDGLRFDAVHAILDASFLHELAREIRANVAPDRHVHLVVENDNNDATLLRAGFDAQWNDDLHHVLHVLLTGETNGYYSDFVKAPAEKLARALDGGFVYQGDMSEFHGRRRGSSTAGLSPVSFVSFLQNHDQTGNRAFGERLTVLADPAKLEAAIALQLLCPEIPMIFMGEESGTREPFYYFTDHQDPGLAEAVRNGRRSEFAKFPEFSDPEKRARIPDPNALETYEKSRPDFSENARSTLYKQLLRLRRERLTSRLRGAVSQGANAVGAAAVLARWRLDDGAILTIASNFGDEPARTPLPQSQPIWGERESGAIPPATTLVWIDAP
jgi:malto-oligosyltrehalose trehalohydrolase